MTTPDKYRSIDVAVATPRERDFIYILRHRIYAEELRQHPENPEGRLTDALDSFNTYLVAKVDGELTGFISITPPGHGVYSIDKYFAREDVPVLFDDALYELRILTVLPERRGGWVAAALMYAALRWIEARGGRNVVVIGRVELLDFYVKTGLRPTGMRTTSGALTFELLTASLDDVDDAIARFSSQWPRLDEWVSLPGVASLTEPEACFHGGAFFDAIGREFDDLDRIEDVISADVLDAWFPPSPLVSEALRAHLEWAVRTSPPTAAEGLVAAIARARGLNEASVLHGAGSSSLIFLAMRQWLSPASRALILDPSYGEYAHVLDNVVQCSVDRFPLRREDGYRVDLDRLLEEVQKGYDLLVLVNPNNPTGQHVPRAVIEPFLRGVPPRTLVWLDEAYLDYVGAEESLERFAAESENVVVCKSMSKVYALSGLRVGYLSGSPSRMEELRRITPPWAVGLPGQLAAVRALQDPEYYESRYRETHALRARFAAELSSIQGMDVLDGVTNSLLCHLPPVGPSAQEVLEGCRAHGLFVRDVGATSTAAGPDVIRIAVKDADTNLRTAAVLREVVGKGPSAPAPVFSVRLSAEG